MADRHVAELRLKEGEKRFRDLADMSSDFVWRIASTPEPRFDDMSPSVEGILGYPPSFFLGDFDRLFEIAEKNAGGQTLHVLQNDRAPKRFDVRFRHANG